MAHCYVKTSKDTGPFMASPVLVRAVDKDMESTQRCQTIASGSKVSSKARPFCEKLMFFNDPNTSLLQD